MNTKHTVLSSMVQGSKGKFFTIQFVKKNGEIRNMTCRLGVKKHLKSTAPSNTSHIDKYMTVYDVQNRGYRTINLDTVKRFKCGAVELITV